MKILPRKKFLPIATAVFGNEEEKEILQTLRSGWITLGPRTRKFEEDLKEYIGAKYAVAFNSCSSALDMCIAAVGIKPGDEVITTTFTYAATVNAILHHGGKPILVDVNPETLLIDEDQVERKITKKTRAIIPVDYSGQTPDLLKLKKICKKYGLYLIEDAAHSIGAFHKNKKVGTIADLTCFSFHPVKNMTTGDGGAVTTNNKKLAEKLMVLRVNGMDKESWKRNTSSGTWDYSIVTAGYKTHMNDLSAALGIHQLRKLDRNNKIREELSLAYDAEFKEVSEIFVLKRLSFNLHAYNMYPVLVEVSKLKINRNQIMEQLKEYNIGSIVYYRPIHLHEFYQNELGVKKGDFSNAEFAFERLICLPLYHGMIKKDVMFVANVLKKIISENSED